MQIKAILPQIHYLQLQLKSNIYNIERILRQMVATSVQLFSLFSTKHVLMHQKLLTQRMRLLFRQVFPVAPGDVAQVQFGVLPLRNINMIEIHLP